MRPSLKHVSLGLSALLLILSAAYILAFKQASNAADPTTGLVDRTYEAVRSSEMLSDHLLDAETGERGYLLTREEKFLEPYHSLKSNIRSELNRLKSLTENDSQQQLRLGEIEALTNQTLANMMDVVETDKKSKLDKKALINTMTRDQQHIDAIQFDINAFNSAAVLILKEHINTFNGLLDNFRKWSMGAAAVTTALLIAYILFMRSYFVVPIRKFQDGINKVSERNSFTEIELPRSISELKELSQDFNKMVSRIGSHEQQLTLALEKSQAANQAKSEFLAKMSHEIRTPLNGVIGAAQLLERERLTPDQLKLTRQITDSGRTLMGIINDILDFSRIESGQLLIERRPLMLASTLNSVMTLLEPAAQAKGLTIEVICKPEIGSTPLLGDTLRLEQILTNLVGNAIKFTQRGGVKVIVQSSCGHAFRAALAFRDPRHRNRHRR